MVPSAGSPVSPLPAGSWRLASSEKLPERNPLLRKMVQNAAIL
jgi:hypothetical protein